MRKIWFIAILFWNSLTKVDSELLNQSTKNVAVLVGQPVTIFCGSSSASNIKSLQYTPIGSISEVPFWNPEIGIHSNFTEACALQKDQFNVILYLNSTSLKMAGTVACKLLTFGIDGVRVIKSSAQLIVLDGNPECSCSTNGSDLQELQPFEMQCNIRYRGNWAPVMEWRLSEENDQVVREGVQTTKISNSSVTSVLKFVVNHATNNRTVNCKTYFSYYTGNVTTNATNIPDYSYTWTSPLLNVTYKPRNLIITPVKKSYKPGEKLTCSADANPSPNYEWKNMSTRLILITGPDFIIPSSVVHFTVECTASNSLGSKSTSITISINQETDVLLTYQMISIAFGILFAISVALIALILMKKLNPECHARQNNTGDIQDPKINFRIRQMNETQRSMSQQLAGSSDFHDTHAYEDIQPREPQPPAVYISLTPTDRIRLPLEGEEGVERVHLSARSQALPSTAGHALEDTSELNLRVTRPTQYENLPTEAHQYVNVSLLKLKLK